jgi:hypothetical protein
MKTLKLTTSTLLLALTAFAGTASAQNNERRVDAARGAAEEGRNYRHESDDWNHVERRTAYIIDRLNRDVRELRLEIGNYKGQYIRDRFHRVVKATEYLNAQFRRGELRGWDARRRADEIEDELERVRREFRRNR